MLSKHIIEKAKSQVRRYLDEELLTKVLPRSHILDIFIGNADESLELAEDILRTNKSDLWVIVTSYYSMFYIANAVLYKKGLKVGNTSAHAITANALIVYVRDSLQKSLIEGFAEAMTEAQSSMKAEDLLDSFFQERKKRGDFQYDMSLTLKKSKAETSFNRAKDFVFNLKKIL